MNVCRSSESIWYISHLLIIQVEWAKISWLGYRRVCPTLISPTFCKWGYYAKNKAKVNDHGLPYLGKERASFVHLSFSKKAPLWFAGGGGITPFIVAASFLWRSSSLDIVKICQGKLFVIQRFAFHFGVCHMTVCWLAFQNKKCK